MRRSRPWLVALLLALLPGLLLAEGEHLRFCLHALVGVDDGCATAGSDTPGCCGEAREGPSVTCQQPCDGCCVEIAGQARERSAPAPSASWTTGALLCLPPRHETAPVLVAPLAQRAPYAFSGAPAPPQAPQTPLRI